MSQERTCPRCGANVGLEDDFCSLCGLRLPRAKEPVEEPGGREVLGDYGPVEKPVKKAPAVKPPPVRTLVLKKCPNCNTPVREDLKFCPNCGFNLEVARIRLRQRVQGVKTQEYSRRDFFSFEGYRLEGVPMTALMLIIWAAWSFCIAAMAFIGWVQPILPPPLPSDTMFAAAFSIAVGILSILSAIGLLMVLRPLFYFIIILVLLEIPVSIMQLMQAAAGGKQVWENFATGLVGLFIVLGLTIQLLRIHKYFTGVRV
ncbi:MAG: zinc ribbon domain-containing protein [Thermoproteota archaeon]